MRAWFNIKRLLAVAFDALYLNQLLHQVQVRRSSPFIRAVNYHDIPPHESEQFEQHLIYYQKHFCPVTLEDLLSFHDGAWNRDKPGLILSFDDGFRSCHETAGPLLEKYGFVGWFFVPSGLLDLPPQEQRDKAHAVSAAPRQQGADDGRVFLTWDQVRDLDRQHVIGCHTLTHRRLRSGLSSQVLSEEIGRSKEILEKQLGHEVPVFAWVGGEEASYSSQAAIYIEDSGFRVGFLTNSSLIQPGQNLLSLDRSNVESSYPISLVRFQLSGIIDLLYARKRRRVTQKLSSHI